MAKLYASEAANRICNRAVQVSQQAMATPKIPGGAKPRRQVTMIYEGTSNPANGHRSRVVARYLSDECIKHAGVILRELTRHILRRPIVGALAVARTKDGRVLLIRRGDSGKWALPGGTLEWSETLTKGLAREVEETGATLVSIGSVRAIYSKPERDWRFHAVTVVVLVEVAEPVRGPHNPLEIREAKLLRLDHEIPRDLDFDGNAVLDQALRSDGVPLSYARSMPHDHEPPNLGDFLCGGLRQSSAGAPIAKSGRRRISKRCFDEKLVPRRVIEPRRDGVANETNETTPGALANADQASWCVLKTSKLQSPRQRQRFRDTHDACEAIAAR